MFWLNLFRVLYFRDFQIYSKYICIYVQIFNLHDHIRIMFNFTLHLCTASVGAPPNLAQEIQFESLWVDPT